MKYSLNRIQIIGNIGQEPKYIINSQNKPRFIFDVCVSEPYKDGEEWKSQNTWYRNCIAWGDLATMLSRMQLTKGERVYVEGKMVNNDWVSQQTDEQHHEMQLKIIAVYKMAKPKQSNSSKSSDAQANGSTDKGQPARQTAPDYQREAEAQMQQDMEDLPF